ncbi:MAG: DUF1730 domain-containing protein, partial [Gammaproteobacteria bacterium]|nr:DUF1730 domain-containing protein [Gammaproteobacteria bacterium]
MSETANNIDYPQLLRQITLWSEELGFQQLGISDIDLAEHDQHLNDWIEAGFHGEMDYMFKHGSKRSHPEQLVDNTCRVISVRMDYMPPDCELSDTVLANPEMGYISRYALGRDYHKVMCKRLQKVADKIKISIGEFG